MDFIYQRHISGCNKVSDKVKSQERTVQSLNNSCLVSHGKLKRIFIYEEKKTVLSVRLDILAVDRQNQVYNIEIQRDDKGAGVKRARYNSSLIDANVTEPGEQYQNLNETYVVFITENDVLG